jgi:hypothetical protein
MVTGNDICMSRANLEIALGSVHNSFVFQYRYKSEVLGGQIAWRAASGVVPDKDAMIQTDSAVVIHPQAPAT